ncbi:MAG: carboxypeptidase regulatory-like domain-containing protein [Candidatus Schekmanbacteria bacterium]|nr:carboxypeptidase regulatory-like domain-containing protein [Candidatus Schekmanbacteria bacterium]
MRRSLAPARRLPWYGAVCIALIPCSVARAATPLELAEHWAPAVYHDMDYQDGNESDYRPELITRFDFDGNWQGNDNWERLYDYPQPAYLYWAYSRSSTHWFLTYMIFHPRDWWEYCFIGDCHENDSEGVTLWIRRDGTDFGALELMQTQAHGEWFQYSDLPLQDGTDNIDGPILWDSGHPRILVQSKGHGVWGHNYCGYLTYFECLWNDDSNDFPGGDGAVYRFDAARGAEVPDGGYDKDVSYELIPLTELWERRFDIGDGHTFGKFGNFDGDTYGEDSASAPWGWSAGADGQLSGSVFFDPALAASMQLSGWGTGSIGEMSLLYEDNIYGGEVYGVVRDSLTGAPVAGAALTLEGRGSAGYAASDGSFSLFTLPGSYALQVRAALYAPAVVQGIEIATLATRVPLEIALVAVPEVPLRSAAHLMLVVVAFSMAARRSARGRRQGTVRGASGNLAALVLTESGGRR